ncbi:carboxymuconolactone decarboxylase family protein [Thalassospira sp. NFXS8]|uniref:carboxymuconolactone decarboxylase family protein n=1 Tax=Thalassospira sp. NFXS8 TaxID=2819093 RepID=UPI0032DFFCAD
MAQDENQISAQDKLNALNARTMTLYTAEKTTMTAFRSVMQAATRKGELSPALKELMAVAIAVAKGCEDCILFHVSEALKHGATRQQLVESLAVSIEMAGGPGTVYAAKALSLFDALQNGEQG